MKVYLVTADGYMGYGAEIYAIGVFYTKEKAQEVASAFKARITEIEIDKVYPLRQDSFTSDLLNENHLGGYRE